jgi:hypothetical protein
MTMKKFDRQSESRSPLAPDRNLRLGRAASAFFVTLLAAGCASMNGLSTQASMDSANKLAAVKSLAEAAVSAAAWPAKDWWHSFNDLQLDQLMNGALADSPTLKVAAARTRKALAFADVAKAALSPQVNASASSTRERFSEHGLYPPPLGGSWSTVNELQVTLDWEVDFWGKNRAAYESAMGRARAAEVEAHAARLALSTNIAQAYVQLQRAYLQLDVAQANLRDREYIHALTRDRNIRRHRVAARLEAGGDGAARDPRADCPAAGDDSARATRSRRCLGRVPTAGLRSHRPANEALDSVALPPSVPRASSAAVRI